MSTTRIAMAMLVLLARTPAATAMCIDVDLRFTRHESPSALLDAMMRETSSIWEAYGVRIEWTTAEGAARCAWPLGSLDVVVDRANQPSAAPNAILGRTRVMRQRIDHAPIQIDRAATEHLIDLLPVEQVFRTLGRPRAVPTDVGRALGRVLAHEIGHVILAAPDHKRRGLMRPTFLSLDLIRPQREPYTLSPEEVEHLRTRERLLEDQLSGPSETDVESAHATLKSPAACAPKSSIPHAEPEPPGTPRPPCRGIDAVPSRSLLQTAHETDPSRKEHSDVQRYCGGQPCRAHDRCRRLRRI